MPESVFACADQGDRVKRRDFTSALLIASLARPARAKSATPVIAYLNGAAAADSTDLVAAFQNGLREAGYLEGQNVTIEHGWAEDHYDRLAALAEMLSATRCQ